MRRCPVERPWVQDERAAFFVGFGHVGVTAADEIPLFAADGLAQPPFVVAMEQCDPPPFAFQRPEAAVTGLPC